jgi:hypothetical protein
MQVVDKQPEIIPGLDAVKKKVKEDLVKKKQGEKAEKDAEELHAALKEGGDLQEASKKYGLTVKATGFFKRTESIPEIGYDRELAAVAYRLSKAKPLPGSVVKGVKGHYVIRFKEKKQPDREAFEKEKEQIVRRLRIQKETQVFGVLLAQAKDKSEIVVEDRFSNSARPD